jgi:hypothetical protein
MMHLKPTLIYQYTNERSASSKEMAEKEAEQLIAYLKTQVPGQNTPKVVEKEVDEKRVRMIKGIYAVMHEQRIYIPNTNELDKIRMGEIIKRLSPVHKALQEHTTEELTTLFTIVKKWSNDLIFGK